MVAFLLTLNAMGWAWQPPYSAVEMILIASTIVLGTLCPLWCAVRIRELSGAWWEQIVKEAGIALAVNVFLALLHFLAIVVVFPEQLPQYPFSIYFVMSLTLFTVFRAIARFVRFWSHKRQESFAVSLANSILVVILIVPPTIMCVFTVGWIWLSPATRLTIDFVYFIGMGLGISIIADIIAISSLLPPALLFSHWVTRRFTRRVSTLTQATGAMRNGDYAVRVAVQGEDEVARLQSDFNAMASELDRTVHELQTERDRVAGILQARRELVAGVSHDLRTPVATIRAHLESVRDVKSVASFEMELEILKREVIRLQSLIDDLFALSQAEVNKLTLDMKPVDAGAIVRERVAAMAPLAWQSGRVQVTADGAAGSPPTIADQRRLEQALTNLIHNAVRHTPPGGVVVVGVSAEIDAVRIDVRDTGEGIAPEDLPHIWDRYYQGKCGSDNHGAGLGLVLVKEFAEAMGGTVSVESELGKGSCFTLRLRCS
jgi:signal transduction histidine kinase